MKETKMYLQVADYIRTSVVDGPGIRQVLFLSGCNFACQGCHNPKLQDFYYGKSMSITDVEKLFAFDKRINRVTFTGGEPMEQAFALEKLATRLISKGVEDILIYSGYTIEEILSKGDENRIKLLKKCSILIDGRFEIGKKNLRLPFRGSANQRIIDLQKIRSLLVNNPVRP
ncbi:MAG: anaerobic ribonucleoside-triphosphate reductase activating protein [Clostridia bacterium]|nr:anaerobic ribonucleoside-triphosphate reductase activating protein [Clostridia bacterium]